jgi:hypothetical protein
VCGLRGQVHCSVVPSPGSAAVESIGSGSGVSGSGTDSCSVVSVLQVQSIAELVRESSAGASAGTSTSRDIGDYPCGGTDCCAEQVLWTAASNSTTPSVSVSAGAYFRGKQGTALEFRQEELGECVSSAAPLLQYATVPICQRVPGSEGCQEPFYINDHFTIRPDTDKFGRRITELRQSLTNMDKTPFSTLA